MGGGGISGRCGRVLVKFILKINKGYLPACFHPSFVIVNLGIETKTRNIY